jgi:D-tyrosyl-tRNA(Tyr) deacylase
MKFVIQRVKSASVKVSGEIVGEINKGMLVLIGFTHSDKENDLDFAANKLLNLRLWDDSKGTRWKESVKSLNLDLLIVSQFTLYSILKGNKPDFHNAMDPEPAQKIYDIFLQKLKKNYSGNIQCGKFGALMEVSLINDGPVTINWEYPEISNSKDQAKEVENINLKINNKSKKNKLENNSNLLNELNPTKNFENINSYEIESIIEEKKILKEEVKDFENKHGMNSETIDININKNV